MVLKGLQKVHEVGARIARKDKAMKDAIHARASALAKKESVDEEFAKLSEELKVLQAKNQSLTEENLKLVAENEPLKVAEHECNVELSQAQLDYSTLLEDFDKYKVEAEEKADEAYNEGVDKAEADIAQQMPSLKEALFSKGWQAALVAAEVDPSSELYSKHVPPSSS